MTTREKLQAIVDGAEPVGCVDRPFTRWQGLHAPKEPGEEWKAKMVDMYTTDQILPMLEQAYRLALEDAATFCDNQNYMILDPLRTRTANDECDAIKASVKFIGNSLRRMAERIGGAE